MKFQKFTWPKFYKLTCALLLSICLLELYWVKHNLSLVILTDRGSSHLNKTVRKNITGTHDGTLSIIDMNHQSHFPAGVYVEQRRQQPLVVKSAKSKKETIYEGSDLGKPHLFPIFCLIF